MSNIEILENLIKHCHDKNDILYKLDEETKRALENIINDYKELQDYANWHIEHLTENIKDYIDDDKIGNASLIGELREEREHWKDIIRIMNNEKTFIDYKNY